MAQDVKTVNGLAIASVKTVNGLAIASVKTINGVDNTAGGGGGGIKADLVEWWDFDGNITPDHASHTLTETGTVTKTITDPWGVGSSAIGTTAALAGMLKSTSADFDITGSFSVCYWAQAVDTGGTGECGQVIGHSDISSNTNTGWRVKYISTGGDDNFQVELNDGGSTIDVLGNVEPGSPYIEAGEWHHYVATYDASAQTLKMYWNGALQVTYTSGDGVPSSLHVSSNDFGILGDAGSCRVGGTFNLCRMGLWTRAITSTEVSTIYNSGSDLKYAAL